MTTLLSAVMAASIALVSQDKTELRAAPSVGAALHASLNAGDALEIRGVRADYLQVYDHRRERAGFVPRSSVRTVSLQKDNAPALLEVARFLNESNGNSVLGIAYTAAYLKAAPGPSVESEPFELLGGFAERLAMRASKAEDAATQGQLDAAGQYGLQFKSVETLSGTQICYEGSAQRQVLALSKSNTARAIAALALTESRCVASTLSVSQRKSVIQSQLALIESLDVAGIHAHLKHRVSLRKASLLASSAGFSAREANQAQTVSKVQQAVADFASVKRDELSEQDLGEYAEVAIRVSAVRPAIDPLVPSKLAVTFANGETGQTCVQVQDAKKCTFGIVWPNSVRANASGNLLTLAVQPMEGWREMWVFRKGDDAWSVDVLPPSSSVDPGVGYVEYAGITPDGKQLLVARETRIKGKAKRSFELVNAVTLNTERIVFEPGLMGSFVRYQDPVWKKLTLALRQ